MASYSFTDKTWAEMTEAERLAHSLLQDTDYHKTIDDKALTLEAYSILNSGDPEGLGNLAWEDSANYGFAIIPSKTTGDSFDPFTANITDRLEIITVDDLKQQYENSGQLRDTFATFEDYQAFTADSQNIILNADWWDAEPSYQPGTLEWNYINGEDIAWAPGQKEEIAKQVIQDYKNARYSAYLQWMNSPEFSDLRSQYGIEDVMYNSDGDQFKWTGTGYEKTMKVDDHASFADYAKVIIQTVVTSALTYGATSGLEFAGAQDISKFLQSSLGVPANAANATANALVTNGLQQIVSGEFDPEQLLVSAVAAGVGSSVAGLTGVTGEVYNSAIAGAVASTFEQAVLNGEIDVNTVLQSGLLSGGTALLNAWFGDPDYTYTDPETGETIFGTDLGGLIDPSSELGQTLYGFAEDARSYLNGLFQEETLEGFTDPEGNFIEHDEFVQTYGQNFADSIIDSVMSGEGTYGGFGLGTQLTENLVNKLLGYPEEVLDAILSPVFGDEWLTNSAEFLQQLTDKASGAEPGANVTIDTTVITPPPEDTTDTPPANEVDCADQNRVQLSTDTCGGCLEGFQPDEFGECVEVTTNEICPEGQVYNDVTGTCVDELFYEEGAPCNLSDGSQGVFDAEGICIAVEPSDGSGDGTGDGEGNGTSDPTTTPTDPNNEPTDIVCEEGRPVNDFNAALDWDEQCEATHNNDGSLKVFCEDPNAENYQQEGECTYPTDDTNLEEGAICTTSTGLKGVVINGECARPNCTTDSGAQGVLIDGVCVGPNDSGTQTNPCDDPAYAAENPQECGGTSDPTTVEPEPEGVPQTPEEVCDAKGGIYDPQSDIADEDGCVVQTVTPDGDTEGPQTPEDCAAAGGEWVEATGECVVSTVEPSSGGTQEECEASGGEWVEATGECVVATVPPEEEEEGGGINFGSGGGSSWDNSLFSGYNSGVVANPQLLQRTEFPITDYLTSLFTNTRIR